MQRLGHYRIEKQLGRGAMGVVYRAIDERLERPVALKVLRLNLGDEERIEFAARLQQEAKSAARLNHPGIITMFESGDEGGNAFLAMEYVDGKTLQELIDKGKRLSPGRVIKVAEQLFSALAYAHEHGVVHRDIKPANLMVTPDGRLKITDFGIAQLPASDLTRTGAMVGSPRHMSPEQVEGKKVDGRADIFSAGIVLYELLSGEKPFDGEHVASIAYKIMHETPPDLCILNKEVTPELAAAVMRCLEKDPAQRYQTAREARLAMRALAGKSGGATTPGTPAVTPAASSPLYTDTGGKPKSTGSLLGRLKLAGPGGGTRHLPWLGMGAATLVVLASVFAMHSKSTTGSSHFMATHPAEAEPKTELLHPTGAPGSLPIPAAAGNTTSTAADTSAPNAATANNTTANSVPAPVDLAHAAALRAGDTKTANAPSTASTSGSDTAHPNSDADSDKQKHKAPKPLKDTRLAHDNHTAPVPIIIPNVAPAPAPTAQPAPQPEKPKPAEAEHCKPGECFASERH